MDFDHLPSDCLGVSTCAAEGRGRTLKDASERVEGFHTADLSRLDSPGLELGRVASGFDHEDIAQPGETPVDGLAEGRELLDVFGGVHHLKVRVGTNTEAFFAPRVSKGR